MKKPIEPRKPWEPYFIPPTSQVREVIGPLEDEEGDKEIEPRDLDRQILDSDTRFFLSGGSTFRAALLEGDTWVKYRHPWLRGRSELLTIGETVYKVHDTLSYQDAYQTFKVTKAGTTDVLADEPIECSIHGWFFPEDTSDGHCPECGGIQRLHDAGELD